jgi:flavin reductase (DIM6/NTAB) family NADH-FMN oxidoreductase RutF
MNASTGILEGIRLDTDPGLFKAVCCQCPSGVAVVTTVGPDGAPHGLTMSAVIALSLSPMQFLISVDRDATTLPMIRQSGQFGINFLNKSQQDIALRFASKSSDKFTSVKHRFSAQGAALIDDAVSSVVCDVHAIIPGGDHEIVIGDVVAIEHFGGEPLVYFNRGFHTVHPG